MKKIISLMIAVMLLISCLPAAMAISGGLGASNATVAPGETVTIAVSVNASDVNTLEAYYSYDEALTFVSCAQGNVSGLTFNAETGVAFSSAEAVELNGTLYTLTFVAPQEAGTYAVSIDGYIADADENVVYAASGSVTVVAPETEPTETEPTETEPTETEPTETEPTETEPTETEPTETKPEPSTEPEGSDDEPKTGDITPQIVMAVASVIAVAAAAMFVFKRKAA